MNIIETYVAAKGDLLSQKLGLKHCFSLEVESYDISFSQGAHLTLSDVKLDMDDLKPLFTEAQLAFVNMWEDHIDFVVRVDGRTHQEIQDRGISGCDYELNFNQGDLGFFPDCEQENAERSFWDAEAKAVSIAAEAVSIVADSIESLEREIFANLQDAVFYNSQDEELVREIKTKNYSVLIYEAESGFFEDVWMEEEYVIQEVESFKEGRNRGFDIKVVILDNEENVITDTYCAYTIAGSDKLKVSDYRSIVSDAIYEARQIIKKNQAA